VYKIPEKREGKPLRFRCKSCGAICTAAPGGGKDKPSRTEEDLTNRRSQASRSERPRRRKKQSLVPLLIAGIAFLLVGGGIGAYFLFFRDTDPPKTLATDLLKDKQQAEAPKDKTGTPPQNQGENLPQNNTKEPPEKEPKKESPPQVPPLYTLKEPPDPPVNIQLEQTASRIVLAPDGKTAVIGVDDLIPANRQLMTVELPSGKTLKKSPVPDVSIKSLALTPDGKTAIIGGHDERFNVPDKQFIRLMNVETGADTGVIKGPKLPVTVMALSKDGSLLAWGEASPANTVRVLELKTGVERFAKDKAHLNLFLGMALTPDNKFVISTGVDRGNSGSKVIVWDIATGKAKHVWSGYPGAAEGLAVSGDSKWVAAAINAGNGGSLRVWSVDTGEEKLALIGKNFNRGARRVVFGPQDKTVIAIFYDGSTRAFDLRTGTEVGGVRGHTLAPNRLALAPDGKRLITINGKEMRLWDFPNSLQKLAKDDQPPFVDIVLDGKSVPKKTPGPNDDPNSKTLANATVDAYVAGLVVQVTAGGKTSRLQLRASSKFFDAGGKQVPAAQAGKVHRVGNTVTIKARFEFNSDVVEELRLVKEGPAELVLEKAEVAELAGNEAKLKVQGKEIPISFDKVVRLVDLAGKDVQGLSPDKFMNRDTTYNVKLRMVEGVGLPLLSEAREVSRKTVAKVRPQDVEGAIIIKSAVLKRIAIERGGTSPALVETGKQPLRVSFSNRTEAYNQEGKAIRWMELFREGVLVSAVCIPRGPVHLVLEIRQLSPLPKEKVPTVTYKNMEVTQIMGNLRHTFIKPTRKKHLLITDANSKALDQTGRPVPMEQVLRHGARVDLIVVRLGQLRLLVVEVRPAGGS
jgi:WD40 repeat protein